MKWNDLKKLGVGDCVRVNATYFTIHSKHLGDGMDVFGPSVTLLRSHSVVGSNDKFENISTIHESKAIMEKIKVEDVVKCSSDEFELTRHRARIPNSIEELIKNFQKDLKKFQKKGDKSIKLIVPFDDGDVEMELKKTI